MSPEELRAMKLELYRKSRISGVIGAIDGTVELFRSRKWFHALNVQAVVDTKTIDIPFSELSDTERKKEKPTKPINLTNTHKKRQAKAQEQQQLDRQEKQQVDGSANGTSADDPNAFPTTSRNSSTVVCGTQTDDSGCNPTYYPKSPYFSLSVSDFVAAMRKKKLRRESKRKNNRNANGHPTVGREDVWTMKKWYELMMAVTIVIIGGMKNEIACARVLR
ncbi:hypothetical protein DPMN_084928 [Dreissena polymorpha]|uniref:Uncharacterized protein n=1 Tax=Dreissena polymorpha TaxID=45954 RepID=A0A9D3YFG1_DREPO|nr:hypothetical protein DPMN_084928 [Dreissena polymorpha]